VAVLGGSGSFAIKNALAAGADAFLTADLKYHNFYEAENQLLLADIGHFESERYTKNYIVDFLRKKILNFASVSFTAKSFYQKKIPILLSTYKYYGEYKRIKR
jgi:putative NIF3 family GTP cyclohydrolase 1 type 2